jgi:hypothetical protein
MEKLRQMKLDEEAGINSAVAGLTSRALDIQGQIETPSNVVLALQQLQSQVSSLSLVPTLGGPSETPLTRMVSAGIPIANLPSCAGCGQPIKDQGLTALEKQWHPLCFACGTCRRPFGNTPFFIHEGIPFCETDYAKVIGTAPMICPGCNAAITGPYLKAMNKLWHPGHFLCCVCNGGLQGGFWEMNGKSFPSPSFSLFSLPSLQQASLIALAVVPKFRDNNSSTPFSVKKHPFSSGIIPSFLY